jgi:uncharacterized membrane protein
VTIRRGIAKFKAAVWLDSRAVDRPEAVGTANGSFAVRTSLSLLAIVVGLGVIFILDAESWYLLFKALHVLSAVAWVGGGLTLSLLVIRLERLNDTNRLLDLGDNADWVGTRLYAPASLLVVITGIAMTINGDLDWGEFWIVFGLIAWAVSTALGVGYLTPRVKRLVPILAERGPSDPEAAALLRNITLAGRIDVAFLLLIVVDMTVKPFS